MRDIEPKLLDDLTGTPALEWAREWSDATEARLDSSALRERIRAALDSDDRIPFVTRRGEYLYNFWRDAEHERGLWRRVTLSSYVGEEQPDWEVLLDVDALAEEEGEDWVYKGTTVLPLSWDRALIRLSRGGADAVVVREFDLETRAFVDAADGGFTIDEAKTSVDWGGPRHHPGGHRRRPGHGDQLRLPHAGGALDPRRRQDRHLHRRA